MTCIPDGIVLDLILSIRKAFDDRQSPTILWHKQYPSKLLMSNSYGCYGALQATPTGLIQPPQSTSRRILQTRLQHPFFRLFQISTNLGDKCSVSQAPTWRCFRGGLGSMTYLNKRHQRSRNFLGKVCVNRRCIWMHAGQELSQQSDNSVFFQSQKSRNRGRGGC